MSSAVELAVEEMVEATVETAVETGVEEVTEDSVGGAVALSIEDSVEDSVASTIDSAVELSVEDAAEDAAEDSAEQGVEEAVEQAQNGTWKAMFWEKIFPAIIAGISTGLVIEIVERSIDAATGKYDTDDDASTGGSSSGGTDSGGTSAGGATSEGTSSGGATSEGTSSGSSGGSSIEGHLRATFNQFLFSENPASASSPVAATPKTTKDKLLASKKLLATLNSVTSRWESQLQGYKDKNDAFGSFKVNRKYENANTVVAVLLTNMKSSLEAASKLAEQSNKDSSWDANITEFQWFLIDTTSRLLSVYKVKAASSNMQQLNFPPDSDQKALQGELERDFPDYKSIIKEMVQKHLKSAVESHAKSDTQSAVEGVIKPPLKKEITKGFDKDIKPSALKQGKAAATAEVTQVFNEWSARINQHAAIPIYGISTLKSWMEHNIQPEAEKKAKEKAVAAAKATIELPDAQIKMSQITKAAQAKVLKEYKAQIDKAASDAAKQAIEDALRKYANK